MKALCCVNQRHNKWFNSSLTIFKHASYSLFFFLLFQFDLYHPCKAMQNVAHALTNIRGHRHLNRNPGLMCPCLTLYVDRVFGHQSFGVRFQCSACRSSWHLCWTWRGKKEKKWISLRLNIVFLKQNNMRDKVVRAPRRAETRTSLFCGSEGLFFRLIIIIRCS